MSDPAHVLFPNDTPQAATDKTDSALSSPILTVIVPNKATEPSPHTEKDAAKPGDVASTLFKSDTVVFDAKPIAEVFDGFANSAISDQDGGERFRAIEAARDSLIADAKAHGTDAVALADVMAVVKERQADGLGEPTPEQAAQRMTDGLEACSAEGITDADLNIARRLIADLEIISPGTIATLERSGAGNDIRLIRTAIKEARRRGYK